MRAKSLVAVILLLMLTLGLFTASVVLAQDAEATEEVTEEPTAEATEEPTAEATEEPTAEATEEPTAEATTVADDDGDDSMYVIQRGDTLYRIATANGLTVTQLAAFNNIVNPNRIFWGTTINIPSPDYVPPADDDDDSDGGTGGPTDETTTPIPEPDESNLTTYVVKTGDTLYRIAVGNSTSVERLLELNSDIQNANIIFVGQELLLPAE